MLFKIVILATYILKRDHGPPQSLNIWGEVDFGPNTACLIHIVAPCRGYRDACVGLPKRTFWQRNLSSLKMDQITQGQESAGSAVGDISIYQGDEAAIQGVTGQTKMYNL